MRLVEKLGLVFLVTLIVLGSLLVYVQTPHGFRHVIVPLAAKFTGGMCEARDGMLTVDGMLRVEGLRCEDPTSQVTVNAERLTVRAALWSFISDIPRIDDLELQQARIVINLTSTAAGTPEAEIGHPQTTRPVLVAIERARFEEMTLIVEQVDRRITGRVSGMVSRLGPGQSGNVTLQTGVRIERKGIPDLLGTFDLNVPVEIAADGSSIQWNGSNRVLLRTSAGALDPADSEVLQVVQSLAGTYQPALQHLSAASRLKMSRAGTDLGSIDLTGEMDAANYPTVPTVTDVGVKWTDTRGDILNLLMQGAAAPHVQAERFNAQLHVHDEGSRTSLKLHAIASGVRLRSGESEVSPPVELSIEHVGLFDSTTKVVTLETLTIDVTDQGRSFLSGALDRPLVLDLDREEKEAGVAEPESQPAVLSLRMAQSDIKDLRPWLAVLGRHTLREVTAGRLEGGLVISAYEHGKIVDMVGRVEGSGILVRNERSGRTGTGPFRIVADWKSRLTGIQHLKLNDAMANISVKGKAVATLHATGEWRLGDTNGSSALSGTMTLTGLPVETLNPLLALWSETTIARAQIDGQAELGLDDREIRWKVDVRSRGLQLHMPATASDAPPLNLEIEQTGKLDRTGRVLRLDRLHIQAVEGQRPVVTVALDRPLTLSLAHDKKKDNPTSKAVTDEITLNLRVNRLGLHQVRPWITMTGSHAFDAVRGGVLDTDVKVRLKGLEDIAVAGRVDADRVTFKREGKHASIPVTLGTEIRASIAGGSRLSFDTWTIKALDRNQQLAQARLTGSADMGGATDLVLDVDAADMSDLVDRLGLLTERQQKMVSGGNLVGNVRVVGTGPDQPLTIKTGLRAANLHIRLDKTHQVTRSLGLQGELEIDGARTMAEIRRLQLGMESGGTHAGAVLVSGRWPVTTEATMSGSMSVALKEWDSQPLIDFLDILPGRQPGPVMVSGVVNVTQRAGGGVLVLKGRETIGPITVAVKGRAAPEPATVQVEHDLTRSGDEIHMATLSINSERPAGLADHVTMNGNARWGLRPQLQLRGSVDALDTDWYAALTAPPTVETSEGRPPSAQQPAMKEQQADVALPLDLDVDLAIETLIYRNLAFGKGRILANGDRHSVQYRLEPTGVAGGSVQGTFAMAQKDGQQDITWDAKGNGLDVGVLMKALLNEPEARIIGLGKFTTSGTGRGRGETLRKSLDGTAVFDIENGRFTKSPVMEFIAKQTRMEEFQGAEFKTLHGELLIKDGWMHLNQSGAFGSTYSVEAGGKIGLDGQLDVQFSPKIGPAFSKHVKIPCLDQFAKASDGLTVLPVTVTAKGSAANPEFGTKVEAAGAAARTGGNLVGVITNLLTGCQGGESEKDKESTQGKATKLMPGLFDRKK
ncbi:MAG TPA: AsmA-like C-terminal region-containing protein [Nitrospira sp.]|nr:AsmA-like C-terminal region-containing protein [Nitrospira sp.]